VVCEDQYTDVVENYLRGITRRARPIRSRSAGCRPSGPAPCFSPDGKWLFVNLYKPAKTVAITGPWLRMSEYFSDPRAAEVFALYAERHQRELDATSDLPTGAFGARRDEFLLPSAPRSARSCARSRSGGGPDGSSSSVPATAIRRFSSPMRRANAAPGW
jgi:hypothetical protein